MAQEPGRSSAGTQMRPRLYRMILNGLIKTLLGSRHVSLID